MTTPPELRPDTIDRREALRRAALLLGGAISAPTLAAMLAGCETPASAATQWTPKVLTNEQGSLVATIAEHIIPTTDTPGAREVGVHRFIDRMLAEYYAPEERAAFLAGLAAVDARARAAKGKAFLALSSRDQHDVLAALDADAYRAGPATASVSARGQDAAPGRTENATADQRKGPDTRPQPEPRRQPFFRTMKELTLLGYYTSQIGATRELKYAQVPGRFDGCVPFAAVGRAWST